MKKLTGFLWLGVFALLSLASCEKPGLSPDTLADIADMNAIAVTADTASGNAIYIINTCRRGEQHRDSVALSALPAAVGTYLSATYPGYTFKKAYRVLTHAGGNEGYIVVIQFEDKPVGLKFDSEGSFIKVFEQRERRDLRGKGWRAGGRFDCRDGLHRDSIALSSLPAAIKSYFSANFPQDTLLHALINKDGSYIVVSASGGMFASIFKSDYTFIRRVPLPAPGGRRAPLPESGLPAAIKNYLTATYPSYVVNKAFAVKTKSAVMAYIVLIDVNATKLVLRFDGNGNFVKNLAIK